jgi:three-Cys-motif partner protein
VIGRPGRSWGFWTEAKLSILDGYLDSFVTASSGQTERIYLDAFAGEGAGLSRLTGEEFKGSARIALEVRSPGFTRYHFFEMRRRARELATRLRAEYPGREITVHGGDCNTTLPAALTSLRDVRWAPTFAFLDPDGMELAWETLELLANHKRGYRAAGSTKPEFKVELWMLFPTAGIVRTMALDGQPISTTDVARATRLFGTDVWRHIYEGRLRSRLSAAEAREEYLNLMRWRLENDLGYRWTHPLLLQNTRGVPLYHMIFGTDNQAGTNIMAHLYSVAARTIPAMRQEARDRASGQQTLDLDYTSQAATYTYAPPWDPPV